MPVNDSGGPGHPVWVLCPDSPEMTGNTGCEHLRPEGACRALQVGPEVPRSGVGHEEGWERWPVFTFTSTGQTARSQGCPYAP